MAHSNFELKPVSPFRLDLTVWTLRRRPHNVVDRWDGYAGLVYFHLLLDRLAESGDLCANRSKGQGASRCRKQADVEV